MASHARSPCHDLILKGERFCRNGDHAAGVNCFEQALQHGTEDLCILSVIYNQLGNAYIYLGNLPKAIEYYQHECTLAQSTGDLLGEAKANSNLCSTFKMLGNYDEAILCSQQQLEIARKLSNKTIESQALYNMGNIYHVKAKQKCHPTAGSEKQDPNVEADLKIALLCYKENLDLVRELSDRALQGRVCGSLGNTHYLLGNCNEAVMFHTERLAIAKEFGDQEAQRRACTNLGNSYIVLGEYEQASQFYLQTLSISRQLSDSAFEAQACYSLGSTYTLLSDYNRAIEYHLRHKQLAKELNDRVGMARACWLLSNNYSSLGNYTKALEYTEQQLHLSTEIGDEPGVLTAQRNLQELTVLLHNHKPDKPRVRRRSMENMQLLSLTPDRTANIPTTSADNNSSSSVKRNIFDNKRKTFHSGVDMRNGNTNPSRPNRPHPCNGVGGVSNQKPENVVSPSPDKFFDLITRLQGRRMDDQRVEMREEAEDNDVDGVDENDVMAAEANPNRLEDQIAAVANNDDQDSHEKMNFMISMLARSQSKRLNDQRVSLNSLPGVRVASGSGDAQDPQAAPPVPVDNHNDNEEIENNVFELDDNFLENLMRCQGTRLNDQRTAAPDLDAYVAPTIPDEDFIALIVRMQSSRIDDQRCHFDPEN